MMASVERFLQGLGRGWMLTGILLLSWPGTSFAQVAPITSSGFNTQVSAPVNLPGGAVQHTITGGTRPGGGGNLFHSFGEFGVPTNTIANFLNDSALPTANILSRVTGGNPSNILGTIQTEGFGNANLFLMNPAGIVFGPNASLNVGGSSHFTTADYLKLSDGVQFTALPSAQDALLSIAPVASFGFLESNPAPLLVEGSTLSVTEGHTLSLVGGDLTISGSLHAANGEIGLVSVSSPGEVLATSFDSSADFTQLGTIHIFQAGEINVSGVEGNGGGTVVIRGGVLTISDDGKIVGNTSGARDAGLVDIGLGDSLILAGTGTQADTQSGIFVQTEGNGKGGTVRIHANKVDVANGGQISATTLGSGDAGTITITATEGAVALLGSDNRADASGRTQEEAFVSGLYANTLGTGRAGTVTLQTGDLSITEGARIDVSTFGRGNGDAGDIHIIATGDVALSGIHRNGLWQSGLFGEVWELSPLGEGLLGSAGNITITGHTVQVNTGAKINVKSFGAFQNDVDLSQLPSPGTVNINTGTLTISGANITGQLYDIDPSEISTGVTGPTAVGHIILNADSIILRDGGLISAETESTTNVGEGGSVTIRALEDVTIAGAAVRTEFPPNIRPQDPVNNRSIFTSGIRATTSGVNPGSDIVLQAKNFTITDGGSIIGAALGDGAGGMLTIDVADTVRLSGAVEFLNPRILNRSTISNSTTGRGNAGELRITARNVEVLGGAEISSKTLGIGNAGQMTIHATENVTLSGISKLKNPTARNPSQTFEISSQISSNARGALGSGGDVTVIAKTVTLEDGAIIQTTWLGEMATEALNETVANTPEGLRPHAGNITINADILTVSGARTTEGNAGFSLFPSQIASGAIGPAGTGNIMVDAREITIRDAAVITSEAESHTPGVQRGIIALTAHENFKIYGGKISAQSSGSGNAGDIHVTAAHTILLDGASITTEAGQASGGSIKLTAQDLIRLNNTTISSSVQGSATTVGGDISLDPDFIVLQNSKILARAVQGQGGNIALIANKAVLVDPLSVLDASSALGVSGSVDIQAPIQNLSGTLAPLPEETTPVTALYGARCAAGSGGYFSTFVDSKAESLSPTPGAFLASPLLNLSASSQAVADRSASQQGSVILTTSIAPLVLGHASEPTTACP